MNHDTIVINDRPMSPDKIRLMDPNVWEESPAILDFLKAWFNKKASVLAKTSGSTGSPQTIHLQKKYALASAQATLGFLDIKPKSTALLSMPSEYIAGRMMIVRAIAGKLNLITSPPSAIPVIPDRKIHLAAFTPHQMTKILKQGLSDNRWNIENTLLGGGPVPHELHSEIKEIKGRFFETFGMTETYSHIAIRRLHPNPDESFRAVKGVTFLQKNGRLIINAPHIGVQKLTTNDLIHLQSPTAFKWLGRVDFIINSGGIKLNPEAIENKLAGALKGLFFITSIPDPVLGQKVALVIEKGKNEKSQKWLDEKFNRLLGKYEKPKTTIWVDNMIMTPTGKINRRKTCNKYKI